MTTTTAKSYKEALRECKRVGTAHASGDALRAMYAALLQQRHGAAADAFYEALPVGDETRMVAMAREWLGSREKAWGALLA